MLNSFLLAALLQSSVAGAPVMTAQSSDVLAPIEIVPVRRQRPANIGVELGWNGLSGAGLQAGYDFTPHFSMDLGGGLSAQTGRIGLRGRYNLLKSNLTPFVGAGVLYGFGTPSAVSMTDNNNKITYKIDRSPLAQGVVGLSYVTRKGFNLMATAGYVQLLRSNNVLIKSGRPNATQKKVLRAVAASGPTVALSVGYAF